MLLYKRIKNFSAKRPMVSKLYVIEIIKSLNYETTTEFL